MELNQIYLPRETVKFHGGNKTIRKRYDLHRQNHLLDRAVLQFEAEDETERITFLPFSSSLLFFFVVVFSPLIFCFRTVLNLL